MIIQIIIGVVILLIFIDLCCIQVASKSDKMMEIFDEKSSKTQRDKKTKQLTKNDKVV